MRLDDDEEDLARLIERADRLGRLLLAGLGLLAALGAAAAWRAWGW